MRDLCPAGRGQGDAVGDEAEVGAGVKRCSGLPFFSAPSKIKPDFILDDVVLHMAGNLEPQSQRAATRTNSAPSRSKGPDGRYGRGRVGRVERPQRITLNPRGRDSDCGEGRTPRRDVLLEGLAAQTSGIANILRAKP